MQGTNISIFWRLELFLENQIHMILFVAQYKKFKTRPEAQEYLDGKTKTQKTIETKSPISKSKISNHIPVNLIKDSISQFSVKKMASSYEKLTIKDDNTSQGKEKKFFIIIIYN
jgi:viroplasmin and RNaseH domain-containing protein